MFKEGVLLSRHSNCKIGGPARYFCEVKKESEVKTALAAWQALRQAEGKKNSPDFDSRIFILGGGTNVLFSDAGFGGLVLKPNLTDLSLKGNIVTAGTGVLISDLLEFLINNSLSGMEWAGGLPGTLGGAIRGNAGAFGGEVKDSVLEIKSINYTGTKPKVIYRNNKECHFQYRDSVFKQKGNEIILSVKLKFKKGNGASIKKAVEEKIEYREKKQPLDYPNIGSIFKNADLKIVSKKVQKEMAHKIKTDPMPVIPTAVLIDRAGLKGVSCGGAMISQKHPNFIVNALGAGSGDVKNLVQLVKSEVYQKFKVKLEEEVIIL